MAEIYELSEDGKFFYELLDKSLKDFTIPDGVETICVDAFEDCKSLESIIIPDGVSEIGDWAFHDCTSLKNIVIPDSVKEIDYYAFDGCSSLPVENGIRYAGTYLVKAVDKSQSNYTIKEGTKWIGPCAFEDCSSLISIVIPDSVNTIFSCAFSGCKSLENVVIPDSVNTIFSNAFSYCRSLSSIIFPEGVKLWGQLEEDDEDDEEDCIGYRAFEDCSSLTSIVIPEGVTGIGCCAFSGCESLENVVIPDSVNLIYSNAFCGCSSLSSIKFPEGVKMYGLWKEDSEYDEDCIDYGAFSGCSSLTSIVIPEGVIRIEDRAFEGCTSLSSIKIPYSVDYIGDRALEDIPINSIEISDDEICNLLKYYLDRREEVEDEDEDDDDVEKDIDFSKILLCILGDPCLDGMNYFLAVHRTPFLEYFGVEPIEPTLEIPDGIKEICEYAFCNTSIETVIFPEGVTEIGDFAFENCKNLHTVILPEGLVHIGEGAFAGCSSLRNMVIPKSVKSIYDYAFDGCDNFDPYPYHLAFTYKSKGKDLEVRTELPKFEINSDVDLSGALKGKQLIKDNDGEVLMSIYDRYDHYITKDLLLDRNLDIIANEDCSHTLYFENVEVGFYMICGIDDETLGAELENCINQRDKYKFLDLFNPYDYEFHEVLAGYGGDWDRNLNYRIYDENDNQIESGQKHIFFKNIIKYTPNYEGDDCFKEVNTKYIVKCYDAYEIGMVPYPVPKDFNMDNIHFNDGNAFYRDVDVRIDLTQIHYKGKVYEAVMDDIGDNGSYGASQYELYKKDENGGYEYLGFIW